MSFPKFKIAKGNDGQFYFHLYATNAENILDSEGYTSKAACTNGIESVKRNCQQDERFNRKVATNGEFYFVLTATNGEIIGKSETYTTESARESGIESVKKIAPGAEIEMID